MCHASSRIVTVALAITKERDGADRRARSSIKSLNYVKLPQGKTVTLPPETQYSTPSASAQSETWAAVSAWTVNWQKII